MDAFIVMVAICMIASFAACGVPFGLIFAERMGGVDVRETGSGNIGMTNVARSVGAPAAALTFACDVGKGLLCMGLSRAALFSVRPVNVPLEVGEPAFASLTVIYACCVLGHVFSPYLHFKGGKGISVGFGAALGLHWPMAAVLLGAFLLLAIPTRHVSAGSIAAALTLPLQCPLLWHMSAWTCAPVAVAAAVVIWAHRGNIVKLARGEERRFEFLRPGPSRDVPPTDRRAQGR